MAQSPFDRLRSAPVEPLARVGRALSRGSAARLAAAALVVGVAGWEWFRHRAGRVARVGSEEARRVAGESGQRALDAWRDRSAARRSRLEARGRLPLPILWEVHPEARRALGRDVGLRSVPIDQIVGTAVAGPAQRGGDFLPLPAFRSNNWRGRWARVQRAVDNLEILPPVDLVKYGDEYWVEDGHNRIAAALYNGQQDVDAVVRELHAPGYVDEGTQTVATLAPVAAAGSELRAAAAGRFDAEAASEAGSPALETPVRDVGVPRGASGRATGRSARRAATHSADEGATDSITGPAASADASPGEPADT